MHYTIDFTAIPESTLIQTSGLAEEAGFLKLLIELIQSPKWRVGTNLLIDHRNLDFKHIAPKNMNMILSIVNMFSKQLGSGKCAFVVQGTSGILTGNYYCNYALTVHSEARVFTDMAKAKNWITGYPETMERYHPRSCHPLM